jgi:hypothetical protein
MFDKIMKSPVTVYHKTGENADGRGEYERFFIRSARFERKEGVRPTAAGLLPYNSFKLFVRAGRKERPVYANKADYEALTPPARKLCWTVAEGDVITLGNTSFSFGEDSADDIKSECEIFTVNSVLEDALSSEKIVEISGRGRVFYT